jgi:hypothetical protein
VTSEVQPGLTPDVLLSFGLALFVSLLFIEHARHAWVDWRETRTGRELRILIIAIALALSLVSATATQAFRLDLITFDVAAWSGVIIRGALVVAGIFDVTSWHLDRRAARRVLDTDE